MPKMSVIAMFVNLRRWFDTLHDRHGSRILLKRQEVFMRMQRQQSQWHGPLVEGRPVRFALVNGSTLAATFCEGARRLSHHR